ncbi:hypothetical protein ACQ5SK_23890 [Bradyrhizobium japonicum]
MHFADAHPGVTQVGAAERSHRIVNLETIDTENLDCTACSQSPECRGRDLRLEVEGALQYDTGFGLSQWDVAETERRDSAALRVVKSVEDI